MVGVVLHLGQAVSVLARAVNVMDGSNHAVSDRGLPAKQSHTHQPIFKSPFDTA